LPREKQLGAADRSQEALRFAPSSGRRRGRGAVAQPGKVADRQIRAVLAEQFLMIIMIIMYIVPK